MFNLFKSSYEFSREEKDDLGALYSAVMDSGNDETGKHYWLIDWLNRHGHPEVISVIDAIRITEEVLFHD